LKWNCYTELFDLFLQNIKQNTGLRDLRQLSCGSLLGSTKSMTKASSSTILHATL